MVDEVLVSDIDDDAPLHEPATRDTFYSIKPTLE
jgi:hypothetical protein